LIIESIPVGAFQCNCVILGDETSRDAVVLDPGDEIERIAEILDHHHLTLRRTIHTHGHLDHIGAAGALKRARGATAHIHRGDLPLWRAFPEHAAAFGMAAEALPEPDGFLVHGDRIAFGARSLEVIETPGHTPGSICLRLDVPERPAEPIVFTGDTLFWKGIGRTDLWGGNYRQLLDSIRERVFALPDDALVHPGHGPATSIHDEKRGNPFIAEILKAPRPSGER